MTTINQQPSPRYDGQTVVQGPFKTSTSAGEMRSEVSSNWYSRPDDQKFLSLTELFDHCHYNAVHSKAEVVRSSEIVVQAQAQDADKLELVMPAGQIARPTHWSFGQACSLVGAPAGYLRKLPAAIAGINLQYGLNTKPSEFVKHYTRQNGESELRALTGAEYGRIYDHEVVSAIQRVAGNGTGDTHWKVPGMLDWRNGTYNPDIPITKETTTLFGSDRDVFIFLVDDKRPIEIGLLPDGSPDLVFRGFYVTNSEVGSRAMKLSTFYLRGVCQNRLLWGVENFQEVSIRHSKFAPDRFAYEIQPALESYSQASDRRFLAGVQKAREAVVATDDDGRTSFLTSRGFTKNAAERVIETVVKEEGKKPESVWDFVQGVTAVARGTAHQDARVDMEKVAGRMLNRVA